MDFRMIYLLIALIIYFLRVMVFAQLPGIFYVHHVAEMYLQPVDDIIAYRFVSFHP